jgi:glycosyltransferase involved in cell wall biosynthesis
MSPEFRYCLKELAIALDRIGVDVSCQPIYAGTQKVQGEERTVFPQREQRVLISLEQKNMDYIKREYVQFPGYHFFIGRQKIGCLDIACQFNHAFEIAQSHYSEDDAFWCLSSHTFNEYLKMGGNPKQAKKIPFGINPELFAPTIPGKRFDTQKGFIFLSMGLPTEGEGLNLLLGAFVEEFSSFDDVCLVLKIPCLDANLAGNQSLSAWLRQWRQPLDVGNGVERNLDQWIKAFVCKKGDKSPEILIIPENEKDVTNMASYYTGCHCFVKPMRTSGFDLSIVEAMACGKPVITTGYGSVLDYCNPQNSYLIAHQMTPLVTDKQGNPDLLFLRWSEPTLSDLKRVMRWVYEHREEASQVGLRAAEQIRLSYTWKTTAQHFVEWLLNLPENPAQQQSSTDNLRSLDPRHF